MKYLGLVLLLLTFGCGGYKQYRAPHPTQAEYITKYRNAKCVPWKVKQAYQCAIGEGKPKADCAMYYMRCSPTPDYIRSIRKLPWARR